MSTAHGIETEVKIRLADIAAAENRLKELGFAMTVQRTFEANTVYDLAGSKLKQADVLLRLRQFGAKAVITWKGRGVAGPHKSRPELETTVGSLETMDQILRALGYQATFRYEKYRVEYKPPGDASEGTVTLDETPIGEFMELEGAADWIDRTAAALGFGREAYELASYGRLYLEHCAASGQKAGHMVFEPRGRV